MDENCKTADKIEWKTPKGYPSWVECSQTGLVRIQERVVVRKNGRPLRINAKPLVQSENKGYMVVQFRDRGKNKYHRVHRLVLLAHGSGDGEGLDVNHINGDKKNNNIENLEWATRSENIKHSYRVLGRKSAMKGQVSPMKGRYNHSKECKPVIGFSPESNLCVQFESIAEAGRNGFSRTGISHCLAGVQKTHKRLKWAYKNKISFENLPINESGEAA